MFDELLILHKGKIMFNDHFREIRPFFSSKGVVIPDFLNPVEYLLNALNLNPHNCQILKEQVSEKFGELYSVEQISRIPEIGNVVHRSTIAQE